MLQNLELTPYGRGRVAPTTQTPAVSRFTVLCLLMILVIGQALWVVKRCAPVSAASLPSMREAASLGEERALSTPPAQPRRSVRPRALTAVPKTEPHVEARAARPAASVRRPLRANDVCLALAGAIPQVELTLDDARRTEMVDTLTQLQQANDEGRKALDQARAAFSDEQLKTMLPLIQGEQYAAMQGAELEDKVHTVLTKVADGAEVPADAGRPLDEAAALTADEVLRGAIALENTSVMLSRSQAAQIDAAQATYADARKRQTALRKQILSCLTPDERARLTAHLPGLSATTENQSRLIKDAIASLSTGDAQP